MSDKFSRRSRRIASSSSTIRSRFTFMPTSYCWSSRFLPARACASLDFTTLPSGSSARHALAAGTPAAALPMSHTPTSLLAARDQPSANRTSFLCKSLKQNGNASRFAFFLRTCRTLSHPPCVSPNILSRFDTPFLGISILVPLRYETLRSIRIRLRAAQEQGRQDRKKAARDDDAFPDDSRGQHSRGRRAKRRQQQHQSCFADSDSPLRDRHHRGHFRQRPREEPHA